MTHPETDALLSGLEKIAGLAVAQNTLQSMLDAVVSLAKELIPNADGSGLTLREEGRWTTTAHSDDFVVNVDARQYEARSGPCLSAATENRLYRVHDLSTDERWPAFAEAAAEAGVRSVLSAPMSAGRAATGAMNLYAFTPAAFDDDSEAIATVLARHAAIAVANKAALGDGEVLAAQLREALSSRQVIGEAKGILMEREKISSDDAFDRLRALSQAQNRKLRTIAEEVVSEANARNDVDA